MEAGVEGCLHSYPPHTQLEFVLNFQTLGSDVWDAVIPSRECWQLPLVAVETTPFIKHCDTIQSMEHTLIYNAKSDNHRLLQDAERTGASGTVLGI